MPFLNNLQKWADLRPDGLCVVVDGRGCSWSELQTAAEELLPEAPRTSILAEPNSVEFVARYSAGVARGGEVAVLDPAWPQHIRDEITGKLSASRAARERSLEDGDPAATFLIGFTAGTTATPKAFTRSVGSWQASFEASIDFFDLKQNDKTLAPGPLSASLNLYALSECLYAGSEFHTLTNFDIGQAHQIIEHHGITRLIVVPTVLRLLSERGLLASVDASAISTIICAGSKLDARTLGAARRWAPHATIFEYYGAAELSFVSGRGLPAGRSLDDAGTAIGLPFPGVQVQILDDDGLPLPEGTPGNISVKSAMVCQDYLWGDDGKAFRRLGDHCTVGDIGYLDGSNLHILGRSNDMMLTAGKNVYPHEVELALLCVPGVDAAVVAGVPDDLRGQRIVAGIVPSCGGLTAATIAAGLGESLNPGKMPLGYYVLDGLPVTDRGKISRSLFLEWIATKDHRARPLT
ncbi:class I adenylate-forming enzyme family protein [Paenarthrobacter nicotinovorans]|uniref:class I adenylate-forming enzyme family protein n=1 Tax=Paenarthrobacter nicotinovorans TaxID=29320 RepID=UPI003822DD4A